MTHFTTCLTVDSANVVLNFMKKHFDVTSTFQHVSSTFEPDYVQFVLKKDATGTQLGKLDGCKALSVAL